ncbi:MAG: hypothetical protein AAFX06_05990 [Planctomycetota bacterium]
MSKYATRLWITAFVTLTSLVNSGCSSLIRGSGRRVGPLPNRHDVIEAFGQPDLTETIQLAEPESGEVRVFDVEKYRVHSRFNTSLPTGAWHPMMVLLEPVLIPIAIRDAIAERVRGHELAFVYDEAGRTIGYRYPQSFPSTLNEFGRDNVLTWQPANTAKPDE